MIYRFLAALALLASCQQAATLADYRQKVGIYVWGAIGGDLKTAAADIKRLGATQVARIYMGPHASWDPAGQPLDVPLDARARRADYHAFLAAFPVVMVTAYDAASQEKYKSGRLDARRLAATRDEFRRFAIELAKLPGRKIISNWEFENDCSPEHWDGCKEYYQARLDGIGQGRKEAKAIGEPGEILTAFEFTVIPGYVGKRSGIVDVGAELKGVDFFSYSSWASIGWNYDAHTMYQSFEFGVHTLRDFVARKKLSAHLIIGEFGEYWNDHPTSERMKALVDASIDNGVDYLFDWVLYDQPGAKDDHGRDASHFGKYTLARALTPQGKSFLSWFAGPAKPLAKPATK